MSNIEINPEQWQNGKPPENKLVPKEEDLPTPYRPAGISGVHGEFALDSGLRAPLLKIIQNVGKSSADHPKDHGALLYNDTTLVPRPASVCFYGLEGYYTQNLAFDPNRTEPPKRYRSIAEIEAAGGNVLPFVKPGYDDNNFVPAAIISLILEAPDNPKSWAKNLEFAVPFERKLFLPACYIVRSTQYRIVTPVVRTLAEAMKREKAPLTHARYTLETRLTSVGGNFIHVPILKRLTESNPEAFHLIAASLFGE